MLWLVVYAIVAHVSMASDELPTSYPVINSTNVLSPRKPLYLGGYFTLGGVWDGSGILPAVEMALDHINDRNDILADYELRMVWNDTRCDSGLGTRMLFDQIFHKPQKLLILGPPCSTDTQAVADAAHYWNLISVSYSAASPALSNRQKYPYFYRTNFNALSFNPVRVRLVREFGWERIALIRENLEVFSLTFEDLFAILDANNITIISSENFDKDPNSQVANLKRHDAKVIFLDMYENMARKVFCEAYKLGMIKNEHVWFIPEWYTDYFWTIQDGDISCSVEEMTTLMYTSTFLVLSELFLSQKEEPTVSGLTPQQYVAELKERLKWPENIHYTPSTYSSYGYDATWSVALMLNKSVGVLPGTNFSNGQQQRLEDFTYHDPEMTEIFFRLLGETDFNGVSGPVSFKNGDRVGITSVEQLRVGCEEGWHLFNGHCYLFITEINDYGTAESLCQQSNAHLTSILNTNEMTFLGSHWRSLNPSSLPNKWLIGLKFDESSNEYLWAQNKVLAWQPEGSTLPLSERPGNCVYLDFTDDANRWVAVSCDTQLSSICQKDGEFSKHLVASYAAKNDFLDWHGDIKWPGGSIPLDHTPHIDITTIRLHKRISFYSFIGMVILAGGGILLAVFFLVFNVYYRFQRFVKMSSPNLNNMIILGSIVIYLSIIAGGLDSGITNSAVQLIACQVRAWLLSIGFVLAFGSMFSKTWRVYRVAALKTPKRRIISDNQLYLMVLTFFCIDVCFLTLWQIFDPLYLKTTELYERGDPRVPNQRLIPYIEQCTSHYITYWLLALYSYKGLLLLFGTFLAWETRKVTFAALNDSKLIGICVYNTIVLCIIGVSVSFIITNDPSTSFIFTSCIVAFCVTLTLVVLFIPKMVSVYKDPTGEFAVTATVQSQSVSRSDSRKDTINEENKQLRRRIIEMETALRKQFNDGVTHNMTVNNE